MLNADAFVRAAKAVGRKQVLSAAMALGAVLGAPHAVKAQNTFPSSGNAGIGTTSPTDPLTVYTTTDILPMRAIIDGNGGSYVIDSFANSCPNCGGGYGGRFAHGTYSSPSIVQTDDRLSYFIGAGYVGGGNYLDATAVVGRAGSGTISASSLPGYITFETEPEGAITRTERMRIDQNGNVGIGTSSPEATLHVAPSSYSPYVSSGGICFSQNCFTGGYTGLYMGLSAASNGYAVIEAFGASGINYGNLNLNPFGGNVGIATTSPSYTLHVNGSVAGTSAYINLSDARLKKDITPLAYGLTEVMKLHPVGFNWKDQDQEWKKRHQVGLIAQEVETVVPEVVTTADDQMQTKSIAYGSLVPVLIQALQEEQQEITELKQVLCQSKKTAKTRSVCSRPSQPAGVKEAMIHLAP